MQESRLCQNKIRTNRKAAPIGSQSQVASDLSSKCASYEYNRLRSREIYIERITHPTVLLNSTTEH